MFDEYGYPAVDPDLRVCSDCFGDDGLKHYVQAHANERHCSFCGTKAKHNIAAPLDKVVEHMLSCLADEYDDPDSAGMVYESAEGGYQGEVWDTTEFLRWVLSLDFPQDEGDKLFGAICDGLGDHLWCHANLYRLGKHEALAYSWGAFCAIVKHERRFFFAMRKNGVDDDELLSPSELLKTIVRFAEDSGLVRTIPEPKIFFRARFQKAGNLLTSARDLGPPPAERAAQSRMSPAGIVMAYVAEDIETAIYETANEAGTYAIGHFRTHRPIRLLDLANLPSIPSIFEEIPKSLPHDQRRNLIFLHRLAADISRPIARDDRIHVEYVPTQVVTEFIRSQLPSGGPIDGIRYRSSRKEDGVSVVLFADESDVVGVADQTGFRREGTPWLELSSRSEYSVVQELVDHLTSVSSTIHHRR